jgi:hypothetical protein
MRSEKLPLWDHYRWANVAPSDGFQFLSPKEGKLQLEGISDTWKVTYRYLVIVHWSTRRGRGRRSPPWSGAPISISNVTIFFVITVIAITRWDRPIHWWWGCSPRFVWWAWVIRRRRWGPDCSCPLKCYPPVLHLQSICCCFCRSWRPYTTHLLDFISSK